MKKIIIIIFCLSVFNLSFSQADKADAEFVKILKEYTLNDDGSIDFHYSKELKLLSHYAFHRLYGETFIVHNTQFQKLKINEAYTIMADGKKIVTPGNAFNEVLPRFANNAPAFNHIREMVVTHTGLEVGAVIHLDYTIHAKKGFYPALMFDEILTESSPVNQLVIKVNIPSSENLNFDLLNINGEPKVANEKGKKVYTWIFESLPASSKDYYQSHYHLDSPRLIFSTADDFGLVYNQFVNQEAFNLVTHENMDKAVAKITTENTDLLAIALAIQKLVANNLKNLNIPLKFSGFQCRTPIETWNSNQGTALEKAILLCALLKKAHVQATPVAIIPNSYFNKQIGDLQSFQEFAVMMNLDDYGEIIISAGRIDKQNQKFNMTGKTIVMFDRNRKSPGIVSAQKAQSKIMVKGDFNFGESGSLSGKLNIGLEANANPYFSIFNDASKMKSIVGGGVSSKDIVSFNTVQLSQEKCASKLDIEKEEPFNDLNSYLSFEIPYIKNGVDSWHMDQLTAQRTSTLEIPENIHEKYSYTISFTDDLKLVTPEEQIEIKNDAGYVLIKFEPNDGKLVIHKEIRFTKNLFETNSYNDFKEIMNVWNNKNYKQLIFKR